ncbi:hypothetical protein B0J13DRAFT_188632 [Dactylonectria estremocensis]|uniref:Uncharacterized protein n=1 Tax=Dactylonectria estremocensis TaxID=1079267 RepID=A0A9P9JBJ7_9HYPO|nr:hypothetical protein B0J13DRAFT_188632 [Dactylonectria estremocensis]
MFHRLENWPVQAAQFPLLHHHLSLHTTPAPLLQVTALCFRFHHLLSSPLKSLYLISLSLEPETYCCAVQLGPNSPQYIALLGDRYLGSLACSNSHAPSHPSKQRPTHHAQSRSHQQSRIPLTPQLSNRQTRHGVWLGSPRTLHPSHASPPARCLLHQRPGLPPPLSIPVGLAIGAIPSSLLACLPSPSFLSLFPSLKQA